MAGRRLQAVRARRVELDSAGDPIGGCFEKLSGDEILTHLREAVVVLGKQ